MKSFSELGLSKPLLQVLPELGFEKPSHIQEQSIPLLSEKPQDFIGLAQTGTGKTAAFGLPLLDWINADEKTTQALILAPTRELGQQIAGQLEIFAKYLPNIQIQSVYGGASIVVQMKDIKRRTPQNIVIGGAAGALPPVIGWTISTGSVSIEPFVFFLIIFFWTPSHFWSLSLYKSEDYRKAKIQW